MRKLQTYFLGLLFSCFGLFASATERWETLRAINMVENPTNQTGYGSRGELGPYQFRSSTWRMHSSKPFRMANDRESADQVAVQHYEWLKEHLEAAGIDPNGYNIALAWNCGITAVLNGRIPMQTYSYAERVNNLAQSYHQSKAIVPEQVALDTNSSAPESTVGFKLPDSKGAPDFKIVTEPFTLRISGKAPRYVIAPAVPPIALVSN